MIRRTVDGEISFLVDYHDGNTRQEVQELLLSVRVAASLHLLLTENVRTPN